MKKLFSILGLLLFVQTTYAQKERILNLQTFDDRKLHFGYYLGMNYNSYKINYLAEDDASIVIPPTASEFFVDIKESVGFNLGFVVDYRLHKNINLRFEPGLMSNSKELTFYNEDYLDYPAYDGTADPVRKVSSTFLHLPLLLKFSTDRLDNIRPYVIGGVSYDYNFSSNEKNKDDNYSAEFRTTTNNFMYEVGIGMDFYFYFFKFSPSIRGVFAINNELVRDENRIFETPVGGFEIEGPWTGPIDFFGTRGIYLNLTFE
ncbi:MAG: porin family protein [Lutimonas sp.]